jgi:hypothetical protein
LKRILILFVLVLALCSTASAWMYKTPTAILDDSTGTSSFPLAYTAGAAETSVVIDARNTNLKNIQLAIWQGTTDTCTVDFVLYGSIFPTFDTTLALEVIDSVHMLATVQHQTVYWEPYRSTTMWATAASSLARLPLVLATDTASSGGYLVDKYKVNYPYLFLKISRRGSNVGTTATGTTYFKVWIHTKQPG